MKMGALLWKWHRWIGLACFLPFLILTVTGLILLLIPAWPGGGASPVIPTGVDQAMATAQVRLPGAQPGMIMPGPSPDMAWTMSMGGGPPPPATVMFNPHDGQILEITRSGASIRDVVLAIHNSLLLGLPGKLVMLMTSIGLLVLGITGFTIMRQRLRVLRRPPWHGSYPVMTLHKWSGLVALIFLMLLTITGFMLLSFKMLGDARPSGGQPARTAPVATGQAGSANASPAFSVADISRRALTLRPGTEIQAIMPARGDGPITVIMLDRNAPPWAKSRMIMFNSQTAAPIPPRPVPAFMQVMIAAKSLHTGLWDGRIVRALYLGGALLCLLLGLSGLILWVQRRRQRARPRGIGSEPKPVPAKPHPSPQPHPSGPLKS